jgi:hypothetical protein
MHDADPLCAAIVGAGPFGRAALPHVDIHTLVMNTQTMRNTIIATAGILSTSPVSMGASIHDGRGLGPQYVFRYSLRVAVFPF